MTLKAVEMDQYCLTFLIVKKIVYLILFFNNIESIFRKSGIDSCLSFCESEKNKRMLDNYVSIIDEIKKEIFSFMDELEEDYL